MAVTQQFVKLKVKETLVLTAVAMLKTAAVHLSMSALNSLETKSLLKTN